jgi:protein-tyrosine phosphatase
LIPLVDLHCHLLAGVDDGPGTLEEALAMCRLSYAEGVRMAAATAHQNDRWQAVTTDRIRASCRELSRQLAELRLDLSVFPTAEVMVRPTLEADVQRGAVLSIGDHGKYLLIEMPHGPTLDIRQMARNLKDLGVRPVLAHPERQADLLHEPGRIEELIEAGCLVQVSSHSITDPPLPEDYQALRDWFRRGVVHVIGSDGHSPTRRPPLLAAAYRQVARWAGNKAADRIFSTNGMAILTNLPLRISAPLSRPRGWFSRVWR